MSALDTLDMTSDIDAEIAALELDLGDDIDIDSLLEDEPTVEATAVAEAEDYDALADLDEELAEEAVKESKKVAKKPAKKAAAKKPRKEAKTKAAPKFRTTLAGGGEPSAVITERVTDMRIFEMSKADVKKTDKQLEAVRDVTLKIADSMMKKPKAKVVNMFESIQKGSGLNIFTQTYLKQLSEAKSSITTKDMLEYLMDEKQNGRKPYGQSTARSMAPQYYKIFLQMGIAVEEDGGIKLNKESPFATRLKALIVA